MTRLGHGEEPRAGVGDSPRSMNERLVRGGATLVAGLLLLVVIGGSVAQSPAGSPTGVLAVYQSWNTTEQSNFTVSLEVASSAGIQQVYFTFCQLSSPVCYLPVTMTAHGANWYVGSTNRMTSYHGMTPGVRAGYNISVVYASTTVTEPSVPNPFGNLTVVQSVTGEYMFQMTVVAQGYALSGVVQDSATGHPISGATVTLTPGNNTTIQTDTKGAYAYPSVPNGTYTLSVSDHGYHISNATVVIAGQSAVKDVAISTLSSSQNKGGFFNSVAGESTLVIVAAVVVLALVAALLVRRKRKGGPGGLTRSSPPPPDPPSRKSG